MVINLDDRLAEMIQKLVATAQPEEIILFGSHAREEATRNSDVDLLVIESEPFGKSRSRRQEMLKLAKAVERIPVSTDILVFAREEVERLRDSLNHVVARALREGKVVYARR